MAGWAFGSTKEVTVPDSTISWRPFFSRTKALGLGFDILHDSVIEVGDVATAAKLVGGATAGASINSIVSIMLWPP